PPSSTLFPYTTLFRSVGERPHHGGGLCPDCSLFAGGDQRDGALGNAGSEHCIVCGAATGGGYADTTLGAPAVVPGLDCLCGSARSEEHTSELQSRENL